MTVNTCLTIAGSDSGGEAGIQADLRTFNDFNCHGLSAVTAVTAQNPDKITSLNPVPAAVVKDQLKSLFDYFDVKFIKTGLLPSVEIMSTIINLLPEKAVLISDPVIASTSGTTIMNRETIDFYRSEFSRRIDFITPNFPEVTILTGNEFKCNELSKSRLNKINPYSKSGYYLKGGHSNSPGIDYFSYGENIWKLTSPELKIKSSHGTGCRLSSAFCAALATGYPPLDAAIHAKNYVYHSLNSCRMTDKGRWLISSPGKIGTLDNRVTLEEVL